MKLCLIAWHFPPINSIGGYRPLRLANHAASQGHDVTVLCASARSAARFFPVDPELGKRIHPRVKVVRAPTLHLFSLLIEWRDRRRSGAGIAAPGKAPAAATAGAAAPAARPKGLLDRLQELFLIPDRYSSFVLTGLWAYLRAYGAGRPDRLYVTGPPWSPVVLAAGLSRLYGIPLTLDYRDPWNFNPYGDERESYRSAKRGLETFALAGAGALVFNTERMRRHYVERFPAYAGKATTIYNGIDEELVRDVEAVTAGSGQGAGAGRGADELLVVHAGMLYAQRMPPGLAAALAEAAKAGFRGRRLRFRFVGGIDRPALLTEAFARAGVPDRLELAGKVPARQAREEQAAADALLILQLGTRIQLPGKVFECALMRKPVLCITETDSETADFVRGFGVGAVLSELAAEPLLDALGRSLDAPADATERVQAEFWGPRLSGRMLEAVIGSAPRTA